MVYQEGYNWLRVYDDSGNLCAGAGFDRFFGWTWWSKRTKGRRQFANGKNEAFNKAKKWKK